MLCFMATMFEVGCHYCDVVGNVWYCTILDLYFPQVGKGGGESISLAFYSRAKRESQYSSTRGEYFLVAYVRGVSSNSQVKVRPDTASNP